MEDVIEYYTECMSSEIKETAVVKVSKSRSKQNSKLGKSRKDISQADQKSLLIHQLEAVTSNIVASRIRVFITLNLYSRS